jgi:hypothetical protein
LDRIAFAIAHSSGMDPPSPLSHMTAMSGWCATCVVVGVGGGDGGGGGDELMMVRWW